MAMTRDEILGNLDRPTQPVEIPEWGGEFLITTVPYFDEDYNRYCRPDQALDQTTYEKIGQLVYGILNEALAGADPEQIVHARTVAETGLSQIRANLYSNEEILRRRMVATVIAGLLNPDGTPVFEWADAPRVRKLNPTIIAKLTAAINELTADATPTIEEAKKD